MAYLRDQLGSIVAREELDRLVGQLRIDYVAPLNDEPTNPCDVSGVEGWGYGWSPTSGDTDPQLGVDHSELPERIRQTLNDMVAGKFVPMLPDGDVQYAEAEQYGNARISPPSKRKVVDREGPTSSSASENVLQRPVPKSRHRRGDAPAYSAGDYESSSSLSISESLQLRPVPK